MELGQSKLDHSEYDTFESSTKVGRSSLNTTSLTLELVDRLEDKLRLIDLCFTRAFDLR